MKTAIITGVLGQDGSYLADYLLSLNYQVYGVHRRVSSGANFSNISDAYGNPNLTLVEGDICDHAFVNRLITDIKPDEFYGLAAQSNVGHSFATPAETFRTNAEAVILQLEAIRQNSPHTAFYNASTSEIFGGVACPPEGYDENSLPSPRSPYAVAKLAALHMTRNYRQAYGMRAASGILFNHSSPRRSKDFASFKITRGVADIVRGRATHIFMGNLDTFRDEGHSRDYVKAMHLILQQDTPDDYVVATGSGATIREMLEYVCSIDGVDPKAAYVADPRFMRPSDVPFLKGNPTKIKSLGWEPAYTWQSILKEMYEAALCAQ